MRCSRGSRIIFVVAGATSQNQGFLGAAEFAAMPLGASLILVQPGERRGGWINDSFIHTASALVFNCTMPALLFLGIIHADLR